MYKLSGVTKNYRKGRTTVAALRGVDLVIERWRVARHPRADRARQDHAAADPRRPGPAHRPASVELRRP